MKIIFFGAGYCTNFIIPLLKKNTQIICTHKEKLNRKNLIKNLMLKD